MEKIKRFIYHNSGYIVLAVFYTYLALYIFLKLYKIDIAFNYLLILLLGIFIGYNFGRSAMIYLYNNRKH